MADKRDTLAKIATELGLMFRPLEQAVESTLAFKSFMERLGWDPDDIPAPVQDLGNAVASLRNIIRQALEDDFSLESILEIKSDIEAIVQAIKSIESAPDASIPPKLRDDNFKTEFPKQLIEYLLSDYLFKFHRGFGFLLRAFGVLKVKYIARQGNRLPYMKYSIEFSDFPKIFDSPSLVLKNAFGWGTPDFDFDEFANIVENLLQGLGTDVLIDSLDSNITQRVKGVPNAPLLLNTSERSLKVVFFERNRNNDERLAAEINLLKLPQKGSLMPGFAVLPSFNGVNDFTMQLGPGITLSISTEMDFTGGIAILVRPNEDIQLLTGFNQSDNPSQASASLKVKVVFEGEQDNPLILLGTAEGSRVQFNGIGFNAGVQIQSNSKLELLSEFNLKNFKLVIDFTKSDGFIQKFIPIDKVEANADITVGLSNLRGIYFSGSGGLEIVIPTHISLGPIEIQNATIGIKPGSGKLAITTGLSIKGELGPITAVVTNIGITANIIFPPQKQFVDFDLDFKPPNGVGLSVDAGVIKGGGFLYFDFDKQEYAGALELELSGTIALKAIGIITTKMPDGSSGFSLLIIITAEFPPLQLGFGFTLLGVGGLLGLNRTVIIEKLKTGIRDNSIKSILFPQDIIANIAKIISDLKQVFPAFEGHFIVGPMGKLAWGTPTIISLELGVLLELPEARIAILGVLRCLLPDENVPILNLQVNFLGLIDFNKGEISFDASLFDSRLLVYVLTGDMALRIKYIGDSILVLTVGGFHPDFKEIPEGLTNLRRLTISLLSGNNPRISIETYFAVTSSTVQFGAKAELYAAACGFNIYGFIGYDVLFRFSPFFFIASINAGLSLRKGTRVIMGITLNGQLSGPTPWNAKGKASVSFFFFSISVSFDETWGDIISEAAKQLADVFDELKKAISDNRNWLSEIPQGNTLNVSLKQIDTPGDEIIVHPFGVLSVSQKVVPLNLQINKFGNQKPKDQTLFSISEVKSGSIILGTDDVNEQFARANYIEMSDSEKLAAKSFENLKSGKKITASSDLVSGMPVEKHVDYELSYLSKNQPQPSPGGKYVLGFNVFQNTLLGSSSANSVLSFQQNKISSNAPKEVVLKKEKFAVANILDMQIHKPELTADTETEAYMMYNELITKEPSLKNKIQVVSNFELSEV